jgi:hypothetical protein
MHFHSFIGRNKVAGMAEILDVKFGCLSPGGDPDLVLTDRPSSVARSAG